MILILYISGYVILKMIDMYTYNAFKKILKNIKKYIY